MANRVFVGNIPLSFDNHALKETLAAAGKVLSARVQGPPRNPGDKNKGFGFVQFSTAEEAQNAIQTLDKSVINGRAIRVALAVPPGSRPANTTVASNSEVGPSAGPEQTTGPAPVPVARPTEKAQAIPSDIHNVGESIIDIGANLTGFQFRNRLPDVLQRAQLAGLSHIVLTGTSIRATHDAIRIVKARSRPWLHLSATCGVHPHHAGSTKQEHPDWVQQLDDILTNNRDRLVSVGECGLDYDRMRSTIEDQKEVFRAQMRLAQKHKLPVFLHCRNARNSRDCADDFVAILQDFPEVPKCVHCHTDDSERHLQALLDADCYIGITGYVADHRRGKGLAAIVDRIPLDRLMIETDAPYLIPLNIPNSRGQSTNEPAYLGWVVKKLAECYEVSEKEIAQATTANAKAFFGLPDVRVESGRSRLD